MGSEMCIRDRGGIPRPVLYFPAVGYPPDAGHGGRRPGSAAYLPPSGTP